MNTALLKPVGDIRVRLPDGSGHLPPDGLVQPLTSYWRRRIADGDVVAEALPGATRKGR